MFGRPKGLRQIANCYDLCSGVFLSASVLAAAAAFWLRGLALGVQARFSAPAIRDRLTEALPAGRSPPIARS